MPRWRGLDAVDFGRFLPKLPSDLRERYGVPYDLDGPRVRLGFAWFLLLGGALAAGLPTIAALTAVVAGFAAFQVAQAWSVRDVEPDPLVSAFFAGGLVVAGAVDLRWAGLVLMLLVGAALGAARLNARGGPSVVRDAVQTVLAAGVVGMAGACAVTLLNYDDRASLAVFLAFVLAYDLGDFVVGSGSTSFLEGPIAGWMALAAVAAVVAALNVPPFRGAATWEFAVMAMVACPLGQFVASAILPSARAPARALRRLDTWLVLAPIWAFTVGLYLQHHH